MRVLTVHSAYQHRGGEDSVLEAETAMLRARGHEVEHYGQDNHLINQLSKAAVASRTLWSRPAVREVSRVIRSFHPDVVHVHNTFPLISPAVYWAADDAGVPVVQTLHNFRLLCPQAMFLRNGSVCEDCLGAVPWRGVVRACYRESRLQSGVLASMVTLHRFLGTWNDKVTRYIALNEFCRQKFIEGGLPADRIVLKPNFVDFDDPGDTTRSGFLYVGRLSPEKGIGTILEAVRAVPEVALDVVGTGPEAERLAGVSNIQSLGALDGGAVRERMLNAVALVLPSIWYENFPRTLVEAMAAGLPVIASRIGALAELVQDGVTGLLFEAGNAVDLASKMRWALNHPSEMSAMGAAARARYEDNYTADRNYAQLMDIYRDAIEAVRKGGLQ